MTEAKIKKKYERLLHAFPILYAFGIGTVIYATHNYNPSGTSCWIAARPATCHDDPEIPCESYGNVDLMKWLATGVLIFAAGGINIVLLRMILWTMRRLSWAAAPNSQQAEQQQTQEGQGIMRQMAITCWNKVVRRKGNKASANPTSPISPLAARLSTPSQASTNRMKEISYRAIFYIIAAFFATYIFSAIYRLMEVYSSSAPPFTTILSSKAYPSTAGLLQHLGVYLPSCAILLQEPSGCIIYPCLCTGDQIWRR